jgi:hypothetical protein
MACTLTPQKSADFRQCNDANQYPKICKDIFYSCGNFAAVALECEGHGGQTGVFDAWIMQSRDRQLKRTPYSASSRFALTLPSTYLLDSSRPWH